MRNAVLDYCDTMGIRYVKFAKFCGISTVSLRRVMINEGLPRYENALCMEKVSEGKLKLHWIMNPESYQAFLDEKVKQGWNLDELLMSIFGPDYSLTANIENSGRN